MKQRNQKQSRTTEHRSKFRRTFFALLKYFYSLLGSHRVAVLRKLPGASKFFRLLAHTFVFPEQVDGGLAVAQLNRFTMYVDLKDTTGGFFLGEYEPETTYAFDQFLKDGDIVVDVGAHWGYFSLLASHLCGEAGKVFAFEAHPDNYALLTKNLAASGLGNVVAVKKAVSNHTGTARFLLSRCSSSHSLQVVPPEFQLPPGVQDNMFVETITLDDFFAANTIRPKLIKLDIEGAEPLALAGMRNVLEQNHELVLVTELVPHYLGNSAARNFLSNLAALGFQLTIIDDDRRKLHRSSIEGIMERIQQEQYKWKVNLLWTRGERAEARLLAALNNRRSMSRRVRMLDGYNSGAGRKTFSNTGRAASDA